MYSRNVNIVFHKVYDHHKLPARQICCVAARQGNFFVVFLDIYKRVHIRVSIFRTTQYQSCGYWVYKHSRSMKRNIFHSKCVLINHMVEMYWNTELYEQNADCKLWTPNSIQINPYFIQWHIHSTYNSICSPVCMPTYLLLFQFCSVSSMVLVICT